MKKFLVLYMAEPAAFETMMRNATPEMQKKGMEAWMKWMGAHQASLVDGGAPLGKTRRVAPLSTTPWSRLRRTFAGSRMPSSARIMSR